MPLSVGARLGPYEILAPIGAGGMGEVYRARDTRLNREVAIKVLPEHLAKDPDALARFQREAMAVAALAHPNILVLYDVGSEQAVPYAVTELLEGETLRERLSRGPLPWRKVAELGSAIAEGLAAAHSKGIVHQDIKPANIFLTSDGRVKILDFGLAQIRSTPSQTEDTATVTEAGPVVMGTIGYMSPEQVRGDKAQAASDIFSLGCVLYEMVTGRRAFSGKSATDTMAAILKDEPPAVADSGHSSSPDLDRVIERCLAKNPAQRFHSAHDLAFALRSLSSSTGMQAQGSAPSRIGRGRVAMALAALMLILAAAGFYFWRSRASRNIDSIAVLPFVNASGGADADWLSDGITESVIDSLSGLPNLKVMSRSAVFRYKGKDADPRAAGKELGVRAVLVGRITQRGDSLSVNAELVDTDDNSELWGDVYNRKLVDALAVQQDIVAQIAGKLRAKLSNAQKTEMTRGQTENPEAYQLYLKGRYYAAKFDSENLKKGYAYFQQAIGLDPNYALAYDGLAYYYELVEDLFFPVDEVMPKAKAAARKALEIDDNIAESHVEMGAVDTMYDFDWAGAEREFKRAIELSPNYAPAHSYYSWYLIAVGRTEEALAESRRAEELDPLSTEISSFIGWWLYLARRYDEAVKQLGKCLDLDPNYANCYWILGQTYEQQGRFSEALTANAKALKIDPGWSWAATESARPHALSGRRAEAQRGLDDLLALSKRSQVPKYSLATVYAALGDKSRALDALEQAYAEHSFFLDFLKSDPQMDSLRSEPRFQELLRRMNFPPQ
jgi:serine/threonine protein kinase/tetratricopeptide (TPR) repeat protein